MARCTKPAKNVEASQERSLVVEAYSESASGSGMHSAPVMSYVATTRVAEALRGTKAATAA